MKSRILRTASLGLNIALLFISIACNRFPSPWTDADLENWLTNNKSLFDQLAVMAESDGQLARVAPDFYKIGSNNANGIREPSESLNTERWNVYRDLFKKLKLDIGLMRVPGYPNVILMIPTGTDPSIQLENKGIAFSRDPLKPQRDNLDRPRDFKEEARHQPIFYKHVTGNWYLYCLFYR